MGAHYTAAMADRKPAPDRKQEEGVKGAEVEAGFDARLARLEALVGELEQGGLDLEAALSRYEEGVGLLAACRDTLSTYRRRVEELTRGAELALEAYPGDPDAEREEPAKP